MPSLHGTPSLRPGDDEGAHASEIDGVPPGYRSIHTALPCTKFVDQDEYTEEYKRDKDCNPDMLTDEDPSTG